MDNPHYIDYTHLRRHRKRIWNVENQSLAGWGGLDVKAIGAGAAGGFVVAAVAWVIFSLFNLPAMLLSIVVLVAVGYFLYTQFTKENVKDTPEGMFKKAVMRRFQPKKYAQAIGADFAADTMQWQVILWRPSWANVRLGDPRRWATYDPAPISEEVRESLDPTGAGELVDWNRHFYFDEEPEEAPTLTSTPHHTASEE